MSPISHRISDSSATFSDLRSSVRHIAKLNATIINLRYADDVILIATSEGDLQDFSQPCTKCKRKSWVANKFFENKSDDIREE